MPFVVPNVPVEDFIRWLKAYTQDHGFSFPTKTAKIVLRPATIPWVLEPLDEEGNEPPPTTIKVVIGGEWQGADPVPTPAGPFITLELQPLIASDSNFQGKATCHYDEVFPYFRQLLEAIERQWSALVLPGWERMWRNSRLKGLARYWSDASASANPTQEPPAPEQPERAVTAQARKRGRPTGSSNYDRPTKRRMIAKMVTLHEEKYSLEKIAEAAGVDRNTVAKWLAEVKDVDRDIIASWAAEEND
ncbi:MAG: hypothetical protein HY689_15690 [Chloroflexi bacterium]|nr:hypothetical protein [Chloroflexota bacterium]